MGLLNSIASLACASFLLDVCWCFKAAAWQLIVAGCYTTGQQLLINFM